MPSQSKAEHNAMAAAAKGVSNLGIPKKVGEEFLRADKGKTFDQATLAPNSAVAAGAIRMSKKPAADTSVPGMLKMLAEPKKKIAAGTIFQASDGSVLLLKRGGVEGKDNFVGHWALPGGGAESGETADQCARREAFEEMGGNDESMREQIETGKRKMLSETDTPNGMRFTTFLHEVFQKFEPQLNAEHTEWTWAKPDALPSPMHPQVAKLLGAMAPQEDEQVIGDSALTIAMDRDLEREKTRDGRLIVKRAIITKAGIYPYRGGEIPGWEALGLDKDRVYNLLRDPEEIKNAMHTLNGVQLLKKHTPVSASRPHQDKTVGSLGTDAEWDGENLYNSLFVNVQDSIDGIESGKQRELSAGYHYKPDMTPGIFGGKHHDGVMRDLHFNHVALVEDGRVGPEAAA